MGKYKIGPLDIYVGVGGKFNVRNSKERKMITPEEKKKIADFFSEHLVKIHYTDQSSYDSGDDDRAGDYYSSSAAYVYREVDVERDVKGLVMHDGEIVGVVFYVKDGNDVYAEVFYFSDEPKNTMTLGYSASHSSNYITVFKIELVRRGEGGAPERADTLSSQKSIGSPDI